jgi:hypothetical protein
LAVRTLVNLLPHLHYKNHSPVFIEITISLVFSLSIFSPYIRAKCEYIYIYIYITSNFNSFGIEILSWSSNQALNIMQGEIMARALTTILYHFIMVVYGKKIFDFRYSLSNSVHKYIAYMDTKRLKTI